MYYCKLKWFVSLKYQYWPLSLHEPFWFAQTHVSSNFKNVRGCWTSSQAPFNSLYHIKICDLMTQPCVRKVFLILKFHCPGLGSRVHMDCLQNLQMMCLTVKLFYWTSSLSYSLKTDVVNKNKSGTLLTILSLQTHPLWITNELNYLQTVHCWLLNWVPCTFWIASTASSPKAFWKLTQIDNVEFLLVTFRTFYAWSALTDCAYLGQFLTHLKSFNIHSQANDSQTFCIYIDFAIFL